MIVSKFGGSSLAEAANFLQVRTILREDPERRYIVVSAPGKRHEDDQKITDLLLSCHQLAQDGQAFEDVFSQVADRFQCIAQGLGKPGLLEKQLETVHAALQQSASRAFIASRGEYLCAVLMASFLELPFVDAADIIRFDAQGRLMKTETQDLIRHRLLHMERAVVPGFYGADMDGNIHTFSRGGSDISGALLAAALNAELYENWTDVTGFRATDPGIIPDASIILQLTYRELRELSSLGAKVLHEESVYPVRHAGIPTCIRNTGNPGHPGTLILPSPRQTNRIPAVTGIAGKGGYSTITLEKNQMHQDLGFGRKVLAILEKHQLHFEHLPTGLDALCVVLDTRALAAVRQPVLAEIEETVKPDYLNVADGLALVTCVGAGLFKVHGNIARLFTAVSEQGISIRSIFQSPSELSVIIGVAQEYLEKAIIAIYNAFLRE